MDGIGIQEFITGLLVGTTVALILFFSIKKKKLMSAEIEVAPDVLELELKRAKRLNYSIAILLFHVKDKNVSLFRKWLNSLGKELRLREYDLILQWTEDYLILILPGAERDKENNALRTRFDTLLFEAGWVQIPYGIAMFPSDSDEIKELIGFAHNNIALPVIDSGSEQ
ncbi:MAG: hypothetical protein P9L92_18505 [Candidatus Electryonea clarkiae]|nr:hypothetical protein [Candidatus Electryonea clarkiae]MDP8286358.1 hypothetical protein [Candidatus Electryonea clarkiae]